MSARKDALADPRRLDTPNLRFIRRMHGSAQSILVEDEAGQCWIVKPKTDLQGANVLANEFIGAEICQAIGLPIPEYKIIAVPESLCNDPRTWIYRCNGNIPFHPGRHFASRYLPEFYGVDNHYASDPELYASLASNTNTLGMFIFDIWAMHTDTRQMLFARRNNNVCHTFFDNSHLFGGPSGTRNKPRVSGIFFEKAALRLYQNNVYNEFWFRLMEDTIPQVLNNVIYSVPKGWYGGDLQRLSETLLERLHEVRVLVELTAILLERILDQKDRRLADARSKVCHETE